MIAEIKAKLRANLPAIAYRLRDKIIIKQNERYIDMELQNIVTSNYETPLVQLIDSEIDVRINYIKGFLIMHSS
jgi:hypothetical protein